MRETDGAAVRTAVQQQQNSVNTYSKQSQVSTKLISRFVIRLNSEPSPTPFLTTYFSKMDFNIIIPFSS